MKMLRSLLTVLVCSTLLTACDPGDTGGGGGHADCAASSSTGDPNPPNYCKFPGTGDHGSPCVDACDCCSANCTTLTMTDGGVSNVCTGYCAGSASSSASTGTR